MGGLLLIAVDLFPIDEDEDKKEDPPLLSLEPFCFVITDMAFAFVSELHGKDVRARPSRPPSKLLHTFSLFVHGFSFFVRSSRLLTLDSDVNDWDFPW